MSHNAKNQVLECARQVFHLMKFGLNFDDCMLIIQKMSDSYYEACLLDALRSFQSPDFDDLVTEAAPRLSRKSIISVVDQFLEEFLNTCFIPDAEKYDLCRKIVRRFGFMPLRNWYFLVSKVAREPYEFRFIDHQDPSYVLFHETRADIAESLGDIGIRQMATHGWMLVSHPDPKENWLSDSWVSLAHLLREHLI